MSDSFSHIIFSYTFDEKGNSCIVNSGECAKELASPDLTWVHLDANHESTKSWLEREVSYLDHLIIDALIAEETRPRIAEFENGLLVILRSVNLNEGASPEDMVSLRIWIDDCRIITIQRRDMKAVFDIRDNLEKGKLIKSAGEFLYNVLHGSLSDTSSFLYNLSEVTDDLEEKVTSTHNMKFREQIIQIRSQSAIFKRYLIPQKEVIKKLHSVQYSWIDEWAQRHFQENYDNIARIIEEAEELRDRSQILHDELSNALSEKINRSMYKLSVITSIFMPLTFITGLLGMNIGGVPGIGEPMAFNMSLFVMLLVFLLQVLFFRRSHWI